MEIIVLTAKEAETIQRQRLAKAKEQKIAQLWNEFISNMKAIDAEMAFVVDKYGYKGAGTHEVSKVTIDYMNRLILHMA